MEETNRMIDETYERIFPTIPVDEWLSVQHVFHWLVYHNDLFGDNIPLSTLLQAVQQSTTSFLSHDANQLHDLEGLRERCGCLIMVEQEEKLGVYQNKPLCHHWLFNQTFWVNTRKLKVPNLSTVS